MDSRILEAYERGLADELRALGRVAAPPLVLPVQLATATFFKEADHSRAKDGEFAPKNGKAQKHEHADYHAIATGEIGHVQGFLVRRTGDDTWRLETPTGHVTGSPAEVQQHIDDLKRREEQARPLIDAALQRADAAPELNPFQHQAELEAEAKAFHRLPHGAQVVSLEPHSRGRLGEVVRTVQDGRAYNRVKLHGTDGYSTGRVEPLDPAHSWLAKPKEALAPVQRPKQGLLFGTAGEWQLIELGLGDWLKAPVSAIAKGYRNLLNRLRGEPEVQPHELPGDEGIAAYLRGEWLPVISSNVAAIRYLPEEQALEIEFHGGRDESAFYRYENISELEARSMAKAPSHGRWVWDNLRKRGTVYGSNPKHPYTFISGPSNYSPKWMESEESRVAHGRIGSEGGGFNLATEPGPFDWMFPAEEKADPLFWLQIILKQAIHCMVVGPSSSGKTTIAQVIAAKTTGQLAIIDPLWEPSTWGGLPGAAVTATGDFAPIRQAVQGLNQELHRRMGMLQKGHQSFERLTIIWDEVPLCVTEVEEAGELIRSLGNFGRHANMHLVGMSQSDRVGSWGLEGYGDAAENFAYIYLGSKAVERDASLAGVDHPALLEWQGQLFPFDMATVRQVGEGEAQPELARSQDRIFRPAISAPVESKSYQIPIADLPAKHQAKFRSQPS